jgi:hypothetical protein
MSPRILAICTAALALAPLAAEAQSAATFRCQGKDGKKYYGNTIPPQCYGRLVEQINAQGFVVKRIEPEANEKELEAKEAEKAQKAKLDAAAREQSRRDRALLATYTSVKDIEDARGRALRDNASQAGRFEQRIKELQTRRTRYEKELDTYKKDGKSSNAVEDNIKNVDLEIAAQQELLRSKQAEVPAINAKYDEDKKRYAIATTAAATKKPQ